MIRKRLGRQSALLAVVVLAAVGLSATLAGAAPSPEELLRQMSSELKDAKAFRFHAEITFDDLLVSGQKIQYAGAADITVSRPAGIYVDYRDDLSAKHFWYDGKSGTLLDVATSRYSQVELPGDIDAAVDRLEEDFGLSLPLADLISSDHYRTIEAQALAWTYLGVHDVEGTPAHHIAIVGRNADLQLWIQQKGRPLPLKMVVTYTSVPRAPQYQAVLMDWELGAKVAAGAFEAKLPKDARRIEFLSVEDPK